jgi:FkbM family methyltransferase
MIPNFVRQSLPPWSRRLVRRLRAFALARRNKTALRAQRAEIESYPVHDVTHTYHGFPLTVRLADPVAEEWYDHDWGEMPEIALLARYRLRPGARVFDAGANQAIVALGMSRIVGDGGLVLAVEALPHNVHVATANKEANGATSLRILHAAVADKPGKLNFSERMNASVDEFGVFGKVEVLALTIDQLSREYGAPDVVFIDVEGFECHALRGAAETLLTHPDCFVEVHTQVGLEALGGSVGELISYFPPTHYDLFMYSDAAPQFIPFDQESEIVRGRFFLIAVGKTHVD